MALATKGAGKGKGKGKARKQRGGAGEAGVFDAHAESIVKTLGPAADEESKTKTTAYFAHLDTEYKKLKSIDVSAAFWDTPLLTIGKRTYTVLDLYHRINALNGNVYLLLQHGFNAVDVQVSNIVGEKSVWGAPSDPPPKAGDPPPKPTSQEDKDAVGLELYNVLTGAADKNAGVWRPVGVGKLGSDRNARKDVLNPMFVMCMVRDRIISKNGGDFGQLKDVGAFITKNIRELGKIAHDAWALSRFVDFAPAAAAAAADPAASSSKQKGGAEPGKLYVMPFDEIADKKATVEDYLKDETRIRQLREFDDLATEMDASTMTKIKKHEEGGKPLPGATNALDYTSTIMAIHAFRKLAMGYVCESDAPKDGKVGLTCAKSSVEDMRAKGIGSGNAESAKAAETPETPKAAETPETPKAAETPETPKAAEPAVTAEAAEAAETAKAAENIE